MTTNNTPPPPPGVLPHPEVRGVRGIAARHDRQRVGLEGGGEGRVQQVLQQGEGRQLRRERLLLRDGRQQTRQVLVLGGGQGLKGGWGGRLLWVSLGWVVVTLLIS